MGDESIRGGDFRYGWAPPRLPQVGRDTHSQALQQTLTHLNEWTNGFSNAVVNDMDDLAFITEKFTENPDGTVSISDPLRLPDRLLYFSEYGASNFDYVKFDENYNDYEFWADNSQVANLPSQDSFTVWNSTTDVPITTSTTVEFGSPYLGTVTLPTGWNTMDVVLTGHIGLTPYSTYSEWTTFSTWLKINGSYSHPFNYTWPNLASNQFWTSLPLAYSATNVNASMDVRLAGARSKGTSGTGCYCRHSHLTASVTWAS